ncbi:[FeFe] hydrogenase H-cluster radical SAM maturase HydE [Cloacibacillus evryensis]|uniref:[FeFe] hydrogenase H-cluster radical SAM maturase HydE n=3 Tax=root TaxID=1 RepID=A0AAW5K3G3_9BACT|nr:[FeFe] hydrogenase H-cluster radical SAM maturase HydE [Cloacibacillus evryensis]EHL65643.1 iron-only hydrogenase maturation rSAM protein HydE [Synergistes sp. 3_1_syn1]MCQ4813293.1 [FeFe] hydrogenase H-cluster radical SAM maturase HydE [Cloacibacillus evryensis]MEA5034979.1 [FeFe] hydrogenase H-cluster radical SAM maturase HydE [Cloacibacillus evryensis]
MKAAEIIESLYRNHDASREELRWLIENRNEDVSQRLFELASAAARAHFGNKIYVRGLIEMTNYCRNDCYYCGIRRGNAAAQRYRLTKEDIMRCCESGYGLGFRTFVLQGGEDMYYTDDIMADIIGAIRSAYPDCAITLSLGEKTRESYQRLYDAGADRYLLRHETATPEHYAKLHPAELSLANRIECLRSLKEIGYQVGCGSMVGSPYQTLDNVVEDLLFIKGFAPQMVGMGPFIPHHETPFADKRAGTAELTLFLLAIVRLMNPKVLLPATTALGTIEDNGRELGVLAGCNVVMPNLSPLNVRRKYMLYDNKISTGDEAAEARASLERRMRAIGYEVVTERGDYRD